jgi:hypothetical protein
LANKHRDNPNSNKKFHLIKISGVTPWMPAIHEFFANVEVSRAPKSQPPFGRLPITARVWSLLLEQVQCA